MEIKKIESKSNKYLKNYRKLNKKKWREKLGLIPIEGVKLVEEAINNNINLEFVIISEEFKDNYGSSQFFKELSKLETFCYLVDNDIFKSTSFTESPQGILACASVKEYSLEKIIETKKDLILTSSIQDPGNLGTLMRSAVAFDFGGIIVTGDSVDTTNEKVVRSSMGAIFNLPFSNNNTGLNENDLIETLSEAGYKLIAAMPDGDISSYNIELSKDPLCIIVGSESWGISKEILASDLDMLKIKIPISANSDSLNAAVAGSILMYEVYRSR
ncbi:TrmH family RNA methyltransferase [Natranaerofaba carboxydovora]|uniref:TrmH family RNA methyltransferase n=1 Tax=Natranaerofaba carboxydovora TaxID=2742683 RepID=UPI001F134B0C|nr:RNA methyltransferase [Natranaerofaba carboxydovora]UMZ74046.1 Putative TrmH family tRNA/rRNA methyltransferase [Natranaerofaba carboxydovora]